jgi:hypothetical protein
MLMSALLAANVLALVLQSKLQGTWEIVTATDHTFHWSGVVLRDCKFIFTRNQLTLDNGDHHFAGNYQLQPNNGTVHWVADLDFYLGAKNDKKGRLVERAIGIKGILRLNNDVMELQFDYGDSFSDAPKRPTDIEPNPKNKSFYVKLKRKG